LGVVSAEGKLESVLAFGGSVAGALSASDFVEDGGDVAEESDWLVGGGQGEGEEEKVQG